jgi:hypothetical protein
VTIPDGGGCTGPDSWPRATWVNGQISPMISAQIVIHFVTFVTFGGDASHLRESFMVWGGAAYLSLTIGFDNSFFAAVTSHDRPCHRLMST